MSQTATSRFQEIPCECCGARRFEPVRDWKGLSRVVRCLDCGLQFVNPMPGEAFLSTLYSAEAGEGENAHPYYQTYIEERRIRRESYRRQYRTRLERLEKYCPHKGKLLDIGCGAGFFLDAARDRGWTPYGIDIVPDFVRFARDELRLSHVHCLPLEQTEFADDFFDAVVLWDLIEHLPHPGACLREIHRILRPGGLVVLWTPNVKNAVYLKARWYGYTPTQHLYFFSPRTLARLLEGSGFQCLYRKTNRAKKGLFSRPQNKPFQKSDALETRLGKLWRGLQRDVKNTLNPVNYLSPVLDWAGYGFNLYVIAHKVVPSPSRSSPDRPAAEPS